MNTHTIVADMRQDVLKIREDAVSQNQVVRNTRIFFYHHPIHTDHHLGSKQVSNLDCQEVNISNFHLVRLGNYRLHHRGPSLDAMN